MNTLIPFRHRLTLTPDQQRQVRPQGLKRGQRFPTLADADAAYCQQMGSDYGSRFPLGEEWEITEHHAGIWIAHGFSGRSGHTNLMRSGVDPSSHEWCLFLWDLACWSGMRARADQGRRPPPAPLHEYLLPGREHWGLVAQMSRAFYELRAGE